MNEDYWQSEDYLTWKQLAGIGKTVCFLNGGWFCRVDSSGNVIWSFVIPS